LHEKWADLVDTEEARTLWTDLIAEDSTLRHLYKSESNEAQGPEGGLPLAKSFTARWRVWNEWERQHQFYIGIPEQRRAEFHVVPQIKKACPSIYKTDVMVRLRGRGSGFLEGKQQKESTDPLMICISGRNEYSLDDYWDTFHRIATLLEETIYARYNTSCVRGSCHSSEIHLDDDWVNGGVRLHGEASSCSAPTRVPHETSSWAQEFTDAWRAWDASERQHQFNIDIPEASRDELQVVKRIKIACRSIFSEHVMLRCRGRGSGFLEGRHKAESSAPLMVCLSGREPYSLDEYWGAFYKFASFLEDDLYADYNASLAKNWKPVHLLHSSAHGGIRKGGRMYERG